MQSVEFSTDDATLIGTVFEPTVMQGAVVIHGATGVPHRFYRHFAQWLCDQGLLVLTYDYRGFGASLQGDMRDVQASMGLWGIEDQAAALDWVIDRAGAQPVWVVGHSLGGLMTSFHSNARCVDRLIAICSGPAHLFEHPWGYMPLAFAFWHVLGPLGVWAKGYLPGKALGLGADIPAEVFWEWRRWCNTRGFYQNDIGRDLPQPDLSAFTGDLRMVALADDRMVPPHVVFRNARHYPAATPTKVTLSPQDYKLGRVDHLGVFRPENNAMWVDVIGT